MRAISLYQHIENLHFGATSDELVDAFPAWYGTRDRARKTSGYRKLYRDLELLEDAAPILAVKTQRGANNNVFIHARHAHRITEVGP